MTFTLPATKVTVPDEASRWTVKSQRSMRTSDGEAFVAVMLLDGKEVGTVENQGNGGGTWFRPSAPGSRVEWEALAKACADQGLAMCEDTYGYNGGEPFPVNPEEWIGDALTTEHDVVKRLNRASKRGTALILDADKPVESWATANRPVADLTDADVKGMKDAGYVQVWRDGQWVAL